MLVVKNKPEHAVKFIDYLLNDPNKLPFEMMQGSNVGQLVARHYVLIGKCICSRISFLL